MGTSFGGGKILDLNETHHVLRYIEGIAAKLEAARGRDAVAHEREKVLMSLPALGVVQERP
jgi:hypothetical protein